jgi:hypothetical protein
MESCVTLLLSIRSGRHGNAHSLLWDQLDCMLILVPVVVGRGSPPWRTHSGRETRQLLCMSRLALVELQLDGVAHSLLWGQLECMIVRATTETFR